MFDIRSREYGFSICKYNKFNKFNLFKFKLINFKDGTREIWFIIIIQEVQNYILKP